MTEMLSGPPRRLATSTSVCTASSGPRQCEQRADLRVGDLAAEPVAAEQKHVARRGVEQSFEIDVHGFVRAERAGDHVFRDVRRHVLLRHLASRGHLPHQAVVERELLEPVGAEAVDAAVADVGHQRALRQQDQAAAGGAHSLEADAALALGEDQGVDLANRLPQRRGGIKIAELEIGVRNVVDGELAGELAGRVGAHAVGDDQEVSAAGPFCLVLGDDDGQRVLVVEAAHAQVAAVSDFDVKRRTIPTVIHRQRTEAWEERRIIASTAGGRGLELPSGRLRSTEPYDSSRVLRFLEGPLTALTHSNYGSEARIPRLRPQFRAAGGGEAALAGAWADAYTPALVTFARSRSALPLDRPWRISRFRRASACLAVALALGTLLVAGGCVRRRLAVRSNPPGALVFVDNQQIGTTPCSVDFTYYGTREIRLVKPGYETLTVNQPIPTPWYEIPPIDFVSENLVPGKIMDHRTASFQMQPQLIVPTEQLVDRANQLRQETQGAAVPPPVMVPSASPPAGAMAPAPFTPAAPAPTITPLPPVTETPPSSIYPPGAAAPAPAPFSPPPLP